MEYAEDEKVSLAGMKVTFDHGYGRSSFDYEDLKNCAFAQFIEVYPDEGYLFRSSFHGQRIHMTYDDGEVYFDAYSAEPMRERGNTDLAVDIRYDGALSSEDSATGAGQYKPGETCVVVANATTPGRTFAYWTDEQGKHPFRGPVVRVRGGAGHAADGGVRRQGHGGARGPPGQRRGAAGCRRKGQRVGRRARQGDELHDVCGQGT